LKNKKIELQKILESIEKWESSLTYQSYQELKDIRALFDEISSDFDLLFSQYNKRLLRSLAKIKKRVKNRIDKLANNSGTTKYRKGRKDYYLNKEAHKIRSNGALKGTDIPVELAQDLIRLEKMLITLSKKIPLSSMSDY
jgi:hypothetical protein